MQNDLCTAWLALSPLTISSASDLRKVIFRHISFCINTIFWRNQELYVTKVANKTSLYKAIANSVSTCERASGNMKQRNGLTC